MVWKVREDGIFVLLLVRILWDRDGLCFFFAGVEDAIAIVGCRIRLRRAAQLFVITGGSLLDGLLVLRPIRALLLRIRIDRRLLRLARLAVRSVVHGFAVTGCQAPGGRRVSDRTERGSL